MLFRSVFRRSPSGQVAQPFWAVHPATFKPIGHPWTIVTKAPTGWWQGRLLVPVALLLLTLGLLLAPRMLRGLRPRMAARMPELRQWLATNRWALLLVPVAVLKTSVLELKLVPFHHLLSLKRLMLTPTFARPEAPAPGSFAVPVSVPVQPTVL